MEPNLLSSNGTVDSCQNGLLNHFLMKTEKYEKLKRRLDKLQPNKYICALAAPRIINKKYEQKLQPLNRPRKPEIVRLYDRVSTRLEQLAVPKVRTMLENKSSYKHCLSKQREYILNRHIRQSFLTLYSHLANVQIPHEKEKPKKWTSDEWINKRAYYKKLAAPRKVKSPPKIKRPQEDIEHLIRRIKKLSKPRHRVEYKPVQWTLTDSLRHYKATKKIRDLAKPKQYELQEEVEFVKKSALSYKISDRIKELSEPKPRQLSPVDIKDQAFKVKKTALKAKTTERIVELSVPRTVGSPDINEEFWKVSKRALKAKPSRRILELAQPIRKG